VVLESIGDMPLVVLPDVFNPKLLRSGAFLVGQLGWLRAAPAVGALLMALGLAHRPPLRRAGRALLWSVAGFGAATVVFGLLAVFVVAATIGEAAPCA